MTKVDSKGLHSIQFPATEVAPRTQKEGPHFVQDRLSKVLPKVDLPLFVYRRFVLNVSIVLFYINFSTRKLKSNFICTSTSR